jgi:hypothetical protein
MDPIRQPLGIAPSSEFIKEWGRGGRAFGGVQCCVPPCGCDCASDHRGFPAPATAAARIAQQTALLRSHIGRLKRAFLPRRQSPVMATAGVLGGMYGWDRSSYCRLGHRGIYRMSRWSDYWLVRIRFGMHASAPNARGWTNGFRRGRGALYSARRRRGADLDRLSPEYRRWVLDDRTCQARGGTSGAIRGITPVFHLNSTPTVVGAMLSRRWSSWGAIAGLAQCEEPGQPTDAE